MESRKMVLMNLFAGQQWRRRHSEQTCDIVGEGEAGTNELSEWLGNIYIPKCKPIASGNLPYAAGSPTPVLLIQL